MTGLVRQVAEFIRVSKCSQYTVVDVYNVPVDCTFRFWMKSSLFRLSTNANLFIYFIRIQWGVIRTDSLITTKETKERNLQTRVLFSSNASILVCHGWVEGYTQLVYQYLLRCNVECAFVVVVLKQYPAVSVCHR